MKLLNLSAYPKKQPAKQLTQLTHGTKRSSLVQLDAQEMSQKKDMLDTFLKSRVDKKDLEKQNIIKEALFGVSLEEIMAKDKERGNVPFLQQCIKLLKETGKLVNGLILL